MIQSIRNSKITENQGFARASVDEEPQISISRRSQPVGISETTTEGLLLPDLALNAYEKLELFDHSKCHEFGI